MREMGFNEHWDKLNQPMFTTFRLPRRDKDWQLGERVRVVYHPRGKDRQVLCVANIVRIEELEIKQISLNEAVEDGFASVKEMVDWLFNAHGDRLNQEPLHKISLQVLERRKIMWTLEDIERLKKENPDLEKRNAALRIAPELTRQRVKERVDNRIPINEADWQKTVIELLRLYGYKVCEFRKARLLKKGVDVYRTPFGADGQGFPDLVAARTGCLLFIECKSADGELSEAQEDWWRLLVKADAEYILARPQNYGYLVERLR